MSVAEASFGDSAAGPARLFSLAGDDGFRLDVSDHGARIVSVWARDRDGALADVALGFDAAAPYEAAGRWYGATCGRVANRIKGAGFVLDGRDVRLEANRGRHQIHGGQRGFDVRLWSAEVDAAAGAVRFTLVSEDGDQGYPGRLEASVAYRVVGSAIEIEMTATADAPTVVGLTNHAYWNLAGHASGDVRDHRLRLHAPFMTPTTEDQIPSGEVVAVAGGAFDFTTAKPLRQDMDRIETVGWDHNFALGGGEAGSLRRAAALSDPTSGRALILETNQPGLQVYAGGSLPATTGKGGAAYGPFAGVALEPQAFPNAPNIPHFPSMRLDPGQTYRHKTRIAFSAA